MADQYEASMFGMDSPYWKDKYGWNFIKDEPYSDSMSDIQENRVLAEALNAVGITPDMTLWDITNKYKDEKGDYVTGKDEEGKDIYNKDLLQSILNDAFLAAGVDATMTGGDLNSMYRKFLDQRGLLLKPKKKPFWKKEEDWYPGPRVDIPYLKGESILGLNPPAVVGEDLWKRTVGKDDDVVETIEWVDPGQQVGPERVPSFDDTGIYPGVPRKGDPDFEEVFWANHPDPKFNAAQFTLRTERITEESEKAEKERRDKISQQKWDAERRARQYDAIAQRLST